MTSLDAPTTNPAAWHALPVTEVERRLEADTQGLTTAEAAARLRHFGANQLEDQAPPNALAILFRQFRSPLIYILVAAAVVTVVLEELLDAAVIAAVLVLNAVIGFTQERKAEGAVRALQQLVAPRTRVLRDGHDWEIDSRELVPGDVVLLERGARVPADARLCSANAHPQRSGRSRIGSDRPHRRRGRAGGRLGRSAAVATRRPARPGHRLQEALTMTSASDRLTSSLGMPQPGAISARGLTKTFGEGRLLVHAVRDVDLDVALGEVLLVMGPSGSGKTTLLLMLGAMLRPTSGTITVDSVDLATAPERRLPAVRARHLGFVFQDFNLLSALSALENVELACNLAGTSGGRARSRATELLQRGRPRGPPQAPT